MTIEVLFRKGYKINTSSSDNKTYKDNPKIISANRDNHWEKFHKRRDAILPISPRGNNK